MYYIPSVAYQNFCLFFGNKGLGEPVPAEQVPINLPLISTFIYLFVLAQGDRITAVTARIRTSVSCSILISLVTRLTRPRDSWTPPPWLQRDLQWTATSLWWKCSNETKNGSVRGFVPLDGSPRADQVQVPAPVTDSPEPPLGSFIARVPPRKVLATRD